jgi:hypothetical protein
MKKEKTEKPNKQAIVMPAGDRLQLLARIAGNVAAGFVSTPSPALSSADKIADASVDVAEAILQRIGLG